VTVELPARLSRALERLYLFETQLHPQARAERLLTEGRVFESFLVGMEAGFAVGEMPEQVLRRARDAAASDPRMALLEPLRGADGVGLLGRGASTPSSSDPPRRRALPG
jgi:hypothetical protein